MGEFTIQCTMCDGSFGSEAEYNEHGCSGEDVKFQVKIKLEPQDNEEENEMERALLNLASSAGELDLEGRGIKTEPLDQIDVTEHKEEIFAECDRTIDPLSFPTDFDVNDGTADQLIHEKDPDSQNEVLHETETFTERYTKGVHPGDAETGMEDNARSRLFLKNYTCTCKICCSVFSRKEDFTKHFKEDHKNYRYRPYECGICGKKFLHKHYVNLHMRVHTGEKPYICKLCPRSYSHKTSFTIHMRIHNGDRPYACGVCGKKCYDKSGLTSHMRSHTKETPYQCEVCGRRFTHSKSLLVHRRNHTGEKPYVCSYCGKAFRHWHKHKIHVRLHTGERPYKCKVCGKGFPRNDEVSRHMRSHQGIKSFKCSICGVYCATQASITGHINLHHSNLKTDEMEPPPEKTLVKDSTSGILGTKVPEPRSIYRGTKLGGFLSAPSTSKINLPPGKTTVSSQNEGHHLSTRVIEVTSKDTPISISTKARKNNSKKLNCILPKPKSSMLDSKENSTMTYQEFLEWQERMLTNQGLVVKGYSTSKGSNTTLKEEVVKSSPRSTKTTNNSLNATVAPSRGKELIKTISNTGISPSSVELIKTRSNTGISLSSVQATAVGKPQYLLLSQGGEGNVTKILLPINMVGQSATTKNLTPTIGLPSAVSNTGIASQPTGQQQGSTRPIFLVSQNMSNQPLLLVSNGGQKMLLMSPQAAGRPGISATSVLPASQEGSSKLTIKEEPKDADENSSCLSGVTIKTERCSPPQSPEIPDMPQIRIKEEPPSQDV